VDELTRSEGSGPLSLPLSVLIDRFAGDDDVRDEAFVRAFSAWMHDKTALLRLDLVEALRLRDVVVTFKMKGRVRLIATGSPPDDLPGEVTVVVDERQFPYVRALVHPEPVAHPYEICTMDYSLGGRRVRVTAGELEGRTGR
jgi:hypothetical protein